MTTITFATPVERSDSPEIDTDLTGKNCLQKHPIATKAAAVVLGVVGVLALISIPFTAPIVGASILIASAIIGAVALVSCVALLVFGHKTHIMLIEEMIVPQYNELCIDYKNCELRDSVAKIAGKSDAPKVSTSLREDVLGRLTKFVDKYYLLQKSFANFKKKHKIPE